RASSALIWISSITAGLNVAETAAGEGSPPILLAASITPGVSTVEAFVTAASADLSLGFIMLKPQAKPQRVSYRLQDIDPRAVASGTRRAAAALCHDASIIGPAVERILPRAGYASGCSVVRQRGCA